MGRIGPQESGRGPNVLQVRVRWSLGNKWMDEFSLVCKLLALATGIRVFAPNFPDLVLDGVFPDIGS